MKFKIHPPSPVVAIRRRYASADVRRRLSTPNSPIHEGGHNSPYAVILAGGAGERLWPASRIKRPKYIMKIMGSESIVQQTIARLKGLIPDKNIFVVTTKDQINTIRGQLKKIKHNNFLIEPCSRNTAAAIGLAAIRIKRKNAGATMVVLPADQYIRNIKTFQSAIKNAVMVAQNNYLVTLGARPSLPHTGYGYIKVKREKAKVKSGKFYYEVEKFVEKPNRQAAEKFLKNNKFFWNAGIFAWRIPVLLDGLKKYMPQLYNSLLKIEDVRGFSNKERQVSNMYKRLKKVSIDYGLMEKAKNTAMVAADFNWADLGSWLGLEDIYKKDNNKNICKALNVAYDTKGSIMFGPKDHLIATCGIKDLVIVHTKDATLVASKRKAQDIKKLVELISKKGLKRFL